MHVLQVELLKDDDGSFPDGWFVIREHVVPAGASPEWVMSVNYKGKATHHHIAHGPQGLVVNKKEYGASWSSVHEIVSDLSGEGKPAAWPVKLVVR
jgi:hypothetical protein